MGCGRCGGYLVSNRFIDLFEGKDRHWHDTFRCVNCGAVEDPVIRSNRRLQSSDRVVRRRDNRGLRNIPNRGHKY